jgi:signal transduction histidine kinase
MIDNILIAEAPLTGEALAPLVPAGADFLLYAVRDAGGILLVASNVRAPDELPFSYWEAVPQGLIGDVVTDVGPVVAGELTGVERNLRLITSPFRYRGELFYFQAAVRDEILPRLLGPFLELVVIGLPVGFFAALLASWVIAGRAVSPLQRFSRAVRGLTPKSLNERLHVPTSDEELARLGDELNSALARIDAAYRAQDQFVSNVSHELRTPISVLLTETQVARMGPRSPEDVSELLERTERELKRMSRLVESILVLARAELLKERVLQAVSVNDVVLESVQHCSILADQNQVHLIPNLVEAGNGTPEPMVTGDTELLCSMVENLVRNAIAHSPAGASVSIEARCAGDSVEVVVTDSGPGIPSDYLERVFDRFVQVPRGRGRGGAGLGLAIARNVAVYHHGSIRARNNDGQGCSFVITLPLSRD